MLQCTYNQQRLRSVLACTHYIKHASWIARSPQKVHTVRLARVWSECAVAVTLFIPLWTARLPKVNTVSESSYRNVQLRRLTWVFTCHTRRFVKPRDYRWYIQLAKALIRLLMCRLRVCRLICFFVRFIVGFAIHRLMRDMFVQTLALWFQQTAFEIFSHSSKKTGFDNSVKLSPLHEISNPVFYCMKCQILFSEK